ncbi:MAG TPA: hypothetical protein VKN99_22855 [Polyangia bacterium]|nr:hypothetical protein [Polyangia bacterium]
MSDADAAVHNPPPAQGPTARPPDHSGTAKTIGILSIVFGGLVALSDLFELLVGGRPIGPAARDVNVAPILEMTRRIQPFTQTRAGLMFFMSLSLALIGIGLIKHRESARKAALVWALAGFAVLGIRAWLWETKIWPTMEPAMREMMKLTMERAERASGGQKPPFDIATLVSTMAHAGEYINLGFLAIFPALLLILMNLSAVKERMHR